jgi:phytoene dehydrogenase-like protein
MSRQTRYDAVVIGGGPNGLAAGITMARAGRSVVVYEAAETVGGGARTQELTLPGFRHDVCTAIHPLAAGSPFFRSLPLARYGLEWVYPPAPSPTRSMALLPSSSNVPSARWRRRSASATPPPGAASLPRL